MVKQSVAERWMTVTLKGGLQGLPEALLQQISEKGVRVFLGQPCTGLTFDGGVFKVCLCACVSIIVDC